MEWEKMFACYTSDKKSIIRIYRELEKLTPQRINNSLNKWANEWKRQFSKEEAQMTNKCMKNCSTSFHIKEMQIKLRHSSQNGHHLQHKHQQVLARVCNTFTLLEGV
jgi:hypothetical protein